MLTRLNYKKLQNHTWIQDTVRSPDTEHNPGLGPCSASGRSSRRCGHASDQTAGLLAHWFLKQIL